MSVANWLFGGWSTNTPVSACHNQVISCAQESTLIRPILTFEILNERQGGYAFRLIIEGEGNALGDIAETITRAALDRIERLQTNLGCYQYQRIPRTLSNAPKNPFEYADTVTNTEKEQEITNEYSFSNADRVVVGNVLYDLRPLEVSNGERVLCPALTLADYRRWGEDCVLKIHGRDVQFIKEGEKEPELSDSAKEIVQPAPNWLKEARKMVGNDPEVFKRLVFYLNQSVLNSMVYHIQEKGLKRWNVSLFPDSTSISRSVQVVFDGTFQKLIMTINGPIRQYLHPDGSGFVKICSDDERYGVFQGVAMFNLTTGGVVVRTHLQVNKAMLAID